MSAETPPALSFDLSRTEDTSGDFPITAYTFKAGPRHFLFSPPAKWKVTSEPTKMIFSVESGGELIIATFKIASPEQLAILAPGQEANQLAALSSLLPAGYTNLKILVNPTADYLPVYGFRSVEAEFNYNFFGRDVKTSVLICQMGDSIGFTAVANASGRNFDEFMRRYHTTLGSLQLIPEQAVSPK